MRRLAFSDAALDNLADIQNYIARESGRGVAEAFGENIVARCERLASLPGTLGTARPDLAADMRSTPHRGYTLYFRYGDALLEIIAVLEAHRDAIAYFGEALPDD
jgi:toxin ParE1/3/4